VKRRLASPRDIARPAPWLQLSKLSGLPLPRTMYERAPMLPGMIPSSPSRARTAPLRVTKTSAAVVVLARDVVVVAVHRHDVRAERGMPCTVAARTTRLIISSRFVDREALRPLDGLDVVREVLRALLAVREVRVGQVPELFRSPPSRAR
jgi:hypothetical protein